MRKSPAISSSGPTIWVRFTSVTFKVTWTTEWGDTPAVEFSFEGGDGADGTPCTGRGWMTLDGETLTGIFYFHRGDESEIELSRMPEKRAKPRKRK